MKKALSAALALILLASLAGCSGKKTPDPPQTSADKRDPAAFTKQVSWDVLSLVDANFPFDEYVQDEHEKWYLGREAKLDWWFQFSWKKCNESFDKYSTLKAVKEITGVDVKAQIPMGSDMEAVNLMMATGDFPDMMTLDPNHPLVRTLIDGGYVYTMDELVAKYEPGFLDEVPEPVKRTGTYDDGKWWGVLGLTVPEWKYESGTPYDLGNQAYNVRHDIWEALGKPSISTPDDLYNTLKLFKQTYPTLGGKDSVGLLGYGNGGDGTLLTLGYSFGLKQYISIDNASGTVTTRYLDPNYPAFIAFMNKLYREGLLDPEFFVKDTQQQTESMATNAFMCPYVWHVCDQANALLKAQNPDSVFVAIPPMSATGKPFSFAGSSTMGGESITLIPKSCKDPEAALRLIRYGYSPAGSLQLYKGNPGEHYVVKDGVVSSSAEVLEAQKGDINAYNKLTGLGDYYALVCLPLKEDRGFEGYRLEYDVPNSYPYSYDSTCEVYNMEPVGDSEAGIALTSVRSIGVRETALAITASSAEESAAIVRQMQADIQATPGYQTLVDYWTNQYKSNVERFGTAKWGNP